MGGRYNSNLQEINTARIMVGLKPLEEKTKKCLGCSKLFVALGESNRFCNDCRTQMVNRENGDLFVAYD